MRTARAVLVAICVLTNADAAAADTTQFTITRNGDPIGMCTMDIKRSGPETSVNITTDLAVNVLFFAAYRLDQRESERWINGHLVALRSTTDNNGVQHEVNVVKEGSDLELDADGSFSRLDQDIIPSTFWNPEFLRHSLVLDTQDGRVTSMSVVDDGSERLTIGTRTIDAHHYTVRGRYSEDVWYDEGGHLVQVEIIGSDGSIIRYQPVQLPV